MSSPKRVLSLLGLFFWRICCGHLAAVLPICAKIEKMVKPYRKETLAQSMKKDKELPNNLTLSVQSKALTKNVRIKF